VQRRLAAILAADVVGLSALMERDEEGTYSRIGSLRREVIEPRLSEHEGRLIKTTGDGFLAEFASPIAALRCALALQNFQLDNPNALRLRIGLDLGDVIIEDGGDVYGEGVNVAARLESLADPCGILVSAKIYSEVEGKLDVTLEDRGEQQLKNIAKPVRAYAVRTIRDAQTRPAAVPVNRASLALPDKPSIAVLPFQNMSGDPEQEYFVDGITEDVLTELSRFRELFVISRNSVFVYKGKQVNVQKVAKELGVQYVVEGSVRKAGNRVRITVQLIDAETDSHLWAERYDRELADIFAIQDEVTSSIVSILPGRVEAAASDRVQRKPPENLAAYECVLAGKLLHHRSDRTDNQEALRMLDRAIALDPGYAHAHAWKACVLGQSFVNGWSTNPSSRYAP
jgi:adenylate cyclase